MIKRIKIRDFKSIRDVDLELDPVTVLVGRSGTGKSNLVQAIRFLRNFLLKPEEAVAYEQNWTSIDPVGVEKPATSVEVFYSVPGLEHDYEYRLDFGRSHSGATLLVYEHLNLGKEPLFGRRRTRKDPDSGNLKDNNWEWLTIPRLANLSQFQDDTPMIGKFPALGASVRAHAALATGIGYYHFPSATLSSAVGEHWARQLIEGIPGFRDDGRNYRDVIRDITQDLHKPELQKRLLASLRMVNPTIASVAPDSVTSPNKIVVGHEVTGKLVELSLEQESDGLRRFYAHLLALYQTPAKLTLVFEEPENAIFPGALSLLAEEFQAAPRENRGQVILTTHSPILLDAFDVENVRVVEMKDGWTVVGRVAKEQREAVRDRLLTAGELLTVDTARREVEAEPLAI